jgi:hypothetical protein
MCLDPGLGKAAQWTVKSAYVTPGSDTDFLITDDSGTNQVLYNQSRAVLIFESNYLDAAWTSVPEPAAENERKLRKALEGSLQPVVDLNALVY